MDPGSRIAALALAAACLSASRPAVATDATPRAIYGPDDRIDVWEVTGPSAQQTLGIVHATAGILDRTQVERPGGGGPCDPSIDPPCPINAAPIDHACVAVQGDECSQSLPLCPLEPFFGQPTAPSCSAVLVGPDEVVTAGHCIHHDPSGFCSSKRFVFGFQLDHPAPPEPWFVPSDDVYDCADVVAYHQDPELSGTSCQAGGSDWAVVRLDRPVVGRSPVALATGDVTVGTPVATAGHPEGLPTKVAAGAVVKSDCGIYLTANLDVSYGNSGSVVFDTQSYARSELRQLEWEP